MVYHGYIHSLVALVMCCRYSESCVSKGYWSFVGTTPTAWVLYEKDQHSIIKAAVFTENKSTEKTTMGFMARLLAAQRLEGKVGGLNPRPLPSLLRKNDTRS